MRYALTAGRYYRQRKEELRRETYQFTLDILNRKRPYRVSSLLSMLYRIRSELQDYSSNELVYLEPCGRPSLKVFIIGQLSSGPKSPRTV